ncbi:DUF3383 family protein [Carnobacterium gallinarum]|uniref:DUF3383 family protein n=1 Tax=Carnobacterium gallinarum TaxID=2749 RepID=UPI000551FDE8|nr:DUF3383 family protein [Carnobacterium gallinarum]
MVEAITDVTVSINVQQPQPKIGLGIPAIFTTGVDQSYKEYTSLDSLKKDFGEDTAVYKKAKAVWAQVNMPKTVAVITYKASVEGVEPKGSNNIVKAAGDFFFENWHFAVLSEFDSAVALALSNFIEEKKFKFLVLQVIKSSDLTPFAKNSLTIGLVHTLVEEQLDAALIGNTANLTVGSVTWKGRPNLIGITAQKITVSGLEEIHSVGGLVYVEKAGISQTSEGKTISGEFIDALHGDHWIKSNIESRLQHLLSSTDKITFDSNGIALLRNELTTVFEEAFTNGIIDVVDETGNGNYSITALQRTDLDAGDIAARNYKGLSFTYKRSGAIHSVDVRGTIEV